MATKRGMFIGALLITLTLLSTTSFAIEPFRYYEQVSYEYDFTSGYERRPYHYPGVYQGNNGYSTSSHYYYEDDRITRYHEESDSRYYPRSRSSQRYFPRSRDYNSRRNRDYPSYDRYFRDGRTYEFDHPRFTLSDKDYRTRRFHTDFDPRSRYFYDKDGSRYYYNSEQRRVYG